MCKKSVWLRLVTYGGTPICNGSVLIHKRHMRLMTLVFLIGDAGDRTRGLSHAMRTRYHCALTGGSTLIGL